MSDTERLDWLERNSALLNFSMHRPHVSIDNPNAMFMADEIMHYYGANYRQAIDEAMLAFPAPQGSKVRSEPALVEAK